MAAKKRRKRVSKKATRETVVSYILDTGCSSTAAAEKFGLNPNTVRSWVSRAKGKVDRGTATQKEAEIAELKRKEANRRASAAKGGGTGSKGPTGEMVLGHLQGATRRILLFMDSEKVVESGRETAALARALNDLTRICPELRQMHRSDEGGEDLDDEADRVLHALGLKPQGGQG